MTVRVLLPGPFEGKLGTVVRRSASGGLWVRFAEWPVGEPDEFAGEQWFERYEVEEVMEAAA